MLTQIFNEEDGTISAVKFIAENPTERQHLADGIEGFQKMTSTPKPEDDQEHKE